MDQGRSLSFVEVLMLGCWSPQSQFIFFGKKIRAYYAQHDILGSLGLK